MTAFTVLLPALALPVAALLAAATVLPPHPTATATTTTIATTGAETSTAPYVVVLKDTTPRAPTRALVGEAAAAGDEIGTVYDAVLNGFAVRTTPARAAALASDPRVASVEPDARFRTADAQPHAPWPLDRIDQRDLPLDGSYTYATKAEGVTVYVVDTGITTDHEEFGGRARAGHNAVPTESAADCNGHGTHVAATVGGATYGVAKGVSLVAVKVADCHGAGNLSDLLSGLDWLLKDATATPAVPAVANLSMGGGRSYALNTAVTRVIDSGITFTVAAGNDEGDACAGSPSGVPQALTVGATDSGDRLAPFSNHGRCVDLSAPGVSVTSAWKGSTTATNRASGTSMAAPHVAGAAALILATGTARTPAEVSRALVGDAAADRLSGLPAGTPNLLLQVPATRWTAP
ncbi:S8 family peptidase [Streptomyces sp. NPDC051567]|uniref:S8 family peptidase n=1 Tax=Streptomyces sp. NPDC051567 TaxID=3365660 RepID=UPI0037B28683